jgi:hypothetical protein
LKNKILKSGNFYFFLSHLWRLKTFKNQCISPIIKWLMGADLLHKWRRALASYGLGNQQEAVAGWLL